MDPFVSLNFEILAAADARINAVSSALLYGRGVFTTAAILEGEPFLWQKHWLRLQENAGRIGLNLSRIFEKRASAALANVIEGNNRTDGRVRITITGESAGGMWQFADATTTNILIITSGDRRKVDSLTLTASPYRCNSRSPLAGIKTCNYLEPLLALDEAKSRGFQEAVRLNERGEVASACMANVFWLQDERLFTPSRRTGCLPGTTREYVLENLECKEVEAGIDEIKRADEIFLTSAGIGVVQVAEFDGRKLRYDDHPITGVLPF